MSNRNSIFTALGLCLFCLSNAACADESDTRSPFRGAPTVYVDGAQFTFHSDEPGLWESNDPAIARIIESDARRAVVLLHSGSASLEFFPLSSDTGVSHVLRVAKLAAVSFKASEPLASTRILVGGWVSVQALYTDSEGSPLAGGGLIRDPQAEEISLDPTFLNEDGFDLTPVVPGPRQISFEFAGLEPVVLMFDAVADTDVVITLSVDHSSGRCDVLTRVTDSAGVPVVGWWFAIKWDDKPLLMGGEQACPAPGQTMTARIGAATATITME